MLEREANQEKMGRREANRDQCQTTRIANKEKGIGRFITSWPIPSGWIRSQVLYPLSYGRIRCVIKNYSESVNEAESAHFNIKWAFKRETVSRISATEKSLYRFNLSSVFYSHVLFIIVRSLIPGRRIRIPAACPVSCKWDPRRLVRSQPALECRLGRITQIDL